MTPEAAPPPASLKLVYVLGAHRSGSSILGVLLGTHPEIRTTGELLVLPSRFGDPTKLCSCGRPATECEFWSQVRVRCEGRVDLAALEAGQRRYENYSSFPRAVLAEALGSEPLRAHLRRSVEFQRVIAEAAGVSILVDLSKFPVRGLVRKWERPFGLDTYFVHMVRDGRAVMYSRLTRAAGGQFHDVVRNAWGMTLRWALVNLLSTLLCGRPRDRYIRVSYEELVSDPGGTLTRLGRFLNVDFSGVARAVAEDSPLPIQHLIDASRFRFRASVQLKADFEWQKKLPESSRTVFWLLAGWLARRYGYDRAP